MSNKINRMNNIHCCFCTHLFGAAKHSKSSKKSKKKQPSAYHTSSVIDHTHLTFGHHQAIVASLALLPNLQTFTDPSNTASSSQLEAEERGEALKCSTMTEGRGGHRIDLLLVGLGGGALPMFINKCIPNVSFFLNAVR